jgi:pimeloyl-ACP methyl ester carboxylesterase
MSAPEAARQLEVRQISLATGLSYHTLTWNPEAAGADDHTVLLLHGFLDNAWTWEALVAAGVAPGARIVAPDWRGHGDSDWIGAGGYYHFFDYVADLDALILALAPRRLSIVGHSMGGIAASYYAGVFPQKLERLVLIEGLIAREAPFDPARIARWTAGWREARTRGTRAYASVDQAAARLRVTDPELSPEAALRLAERGTQRGSDGKLRFKHDPLHTTTGPTAFNLAAAENFWSAVTCPVLLVEGSTSPFRLNPEDVAHRHGAFRSAARVTHTVLEGTAHSPHRHRAPELAALINQHFAE